ncbi:endonuclease III [Desulfuromonas sp. AOP6]|uniref:endonuclease III n=1 Tax=Desulfuromonas sp. AOP6 TaxID=1566351 RepID=UPI001277DBF4|nr:endonuclease III [Desulfuromonas sp. AOP6]BCA78223.1 endonuclease III [Desulfuromonas sp. AOP6]
MAKKRGQSQALETLAILEEIYPEAHCALYYRNPWELLVATILSAQCTDVRVNQVTRTLFRKFPDMEAFAAADLLDLEDAVRSTGFFRNKAKGIQGSAKVLLETHGGAVPQTLAELVVLPGVGRKTANVVLGNAFNIPAMVVDTHVGRVSRRLGWTTALTPEAVEQDLCALLPSEKWTMTSHILIFHGRSFCKAPTPLCSTCPLLSRCPRHGVTRSR